MPRHLRRGKLKKLTKEDRVKRELRKQRRGPKRQKVGEAWSLQKIVEEQRETRFQKIKDKLGISDGPHHPEEVRDRIERGQA